MALAAAGPLPLQAAVFVHNVSVGPQAAGFTNNVNLPQFDPSLGQLISVQIRIEGSFDGEVGVENIEDKFNTIYGTLAGAFQVLDDDDDLILNLNLSQTGDLVVDPFDGNLDYGGTSGYTFTGLNPSGASSLLYYIHNDDLSPFIGLGNLLYTITASDDSFATAGEGTPVYYSLLSGTANFEITYTTAVIPEPAAVANLAVALSVCYALRRRRQLVSRR